MTARASQLTRARTEKARRSLAEFIRQGWHVLEPGVTLLWNWHIDAIAEHLQALHMDWIAHAQDPSYVQRFRQLLINVPPGTAKSRIMSVYAPAWVWLHWPSWRAIYLSANPRVAVRDSMYCRLVLESEWYKNTFDIDWALADDQNAKTLFYNSRGGFRMALGITANIVGDRADHLGVDDPNDPFEVQSEVNRVAVNEKWDSAVANRVNDLRCSTRCGIMQRLHEDDWSGHVLAQGGWEHLCLPMEYEADRFDPKSKHHIPKRTILGWSDPRTRDGEILHPTRFPPEVLADELRRLGPNGYAGQHQQRPAPAEGNRFKKSWWRFWKPDGTAPENSGGRPKHCFQGPALAMPDRLDREIISLDAAFKDKKGNSYVVFQVWGCWKANRFLLDQVRGHFGYTDTKRVLKELVKLYPRATRRIIEDKANGTAIIDELKTELAGIVEVEPKGGKESRAAACEPQIASGNVYLPDGAPWLEDFIEEFALFPNGTHDDQVDCASQALLDLSGGASVARSIGMARL